MLRIQVQSGLDACMKVVRAGTAPAAVDASPVRRLGTLFALGRLPLTVDRITPNDRWHPRFRSKGQTRERPKAWP
jgi:hypothetical protein